SLSMVYDREMGSMRTLMVSPMPRWYLLTSKLLAAVLVSILQVFVYLVIVPMFFASSALYPLWRMKESSLALYYICAWNPFSHAVELIRFALYGQVNWPALA